MVCFVQLLTLLICHARDFFMSLWTNLPLSTYISMIGFTAKSQVYILLVLRIKKLARTLTKELSKAAVSQMTGVSDSSGNFVIK